MIISSLLLIPYTVSSASQSPIYLQSKGTSTEDVDKPISGDKMYYYDSKAESYYLRDQGFPSSISWSPDGKKIILLLEYGMIQRNHEPMPVIRKDLNFLNYSLRGKFALAILIVNTETKTITPFVLPFALEWIPRNIAWWDKDSILIVGKVINGLLTFSNNSPEALEVGLTKISLVDKSYQFIAIPNKVLNILDPECAFIDFSTSVYHHHSLDIIGLAFNQCNAMGGGNGIMFFSRDGRVITLTRRIKKSDLDSAAEMPKGYLFSTDKYFMIETGIFNFTARLDAMSKCSPPCAITPKGRIAAIRTIGGSNVNKKNIFDNMGREVYLYISEP